MKLILLSYENQFSGEESILQQLFEEGLSLFHLRKPAWTKDQLRAFLEAIDSSYHQRIVLHDHYALINDFNLGGIHLNDRNREEWKNIKACFGSAQHATQHSVSCHTFEELNALGTEFSYAFLSPVFESISKQGYTPTLSRKEIYDGLQHKPCPVVALGGITAENIEDCQDLGFDGVAVLGAIWKSSDPLMAFKEINEACRRSAITY